MTIESNSIIGTAQLRTHKHYYNNMQYYDSAVHLLC